MSRGASLVAHQHVSFRVHVNVAREQLAQADAVPRYRIYAPAFPGFLNDDIVLDVANRCVSIR